MTDSKYKHVLPLRADNFKPLAIDGALTGPGSGSGGIPFRDSADYYLRVLERQSLKVEDLTSANQENGDEAIAYMALAQSQFDRLREQIQQHPYLDQPTLDAIQQLLNCLLIDKE